jgi:hypothetical protein
MHKRESLAYENELRAVGFGIECDPDGLTPAQVEKLKGLQVKCDLGILIDEIRIAPTAPTWVIASVQSVVRHYSDRFEVKESALTAPPIW